MLIFLTIPVTLFAQREKDGFIVKKIKNLYSGSIDTYYRDALFDYNLQAPKDSEGIYPELAGKEFNSISKLNKITCQVFTDEEIEYLATKPCHANCMVSSSGIIVSVSFRFSGWDPGINTKKLAEISSLIKENITYNFTFRREIKQEGYIEQSFPIFRQLPTGRKEKMR